ncbi:MAG: Fe-S cluster assembly protein SufD [Pirellulaceae bacterium]
METTTQAGFTPAAFEAFLEASHDPPWLVDMRRQAWQRFLELPWPARSDEEWSRTDIRLFKLDKFPFPLSADAETSSSPAVGAPLLSAGVELGGQLVSVNGRTVESSVRPRWTEQGVLFGSLSELLQQHAELLRPHLLRRVVDPGYDKFSALRAACWSDGQVLYVPRGVVVNEPLHALSILGDGGADISHALVVLEEGTEATLLCETDGIHETDAGFHCGALEIILRPGSHLRVVNLQNWGRGTWHFAHHKAVVERDASLQWTVAAMGGRLAKVNQHVELNGPGASCQVNGVLFTEGKQHIAYNTLQHHVAPNCRSDFLYKGALQDSSRTVWRGMIKVDRNAQQTDGYQRNDNLLLSSHVRADSIPGLEIEADNVRCTHGSTTGRVDEELIFYARCRGFTRQEAIKAIVTGFFQQIFDRITIESVREALGLAIGRRVRDYV